MRNLGIPVLLVLLCMAVPAAAQDMKGTREETTKDFQPTDEFKGMAQEPRRAREGNPADDPAELRGRACG